MDLLVETLELESLSGLRRLVADLRGNMVGDSGERELARAVGVWLLEERSEEKTGPIGSNTFLCNL